MKTNDFTEIASRYERDSLVQKSAAEKLIGLLDIGQGDDILDLGCGAGNLTRKLRLLTDGTVLGLDPSEGMVREAKEKQRGLKIDFGMGSAESMDHEAEFSVIFCNSAFQWFRDPAKALENCYRALRPGGRMGIQAPATRNYCPNFLAAIDAVTRDPRTAGIFSGFRPPWLFLDTAGEYSVLFAQAGFTVPFARIEAVTTMHAPDEVMAIFESGAAAGYLNREYYHDGFDEAYAAAFREIVLSSFRAQSGQDGNVSLTFNRIYLAAIRT